MTTPTDLTQYIAPDALAYSQACPVETARVRACPEDFHVEELLGFELEGTGQHQWLWVEKRSTTTEDVARAIANAADIPRHRVSYAGMKDRNAVTLQWFSVDLAGKPPPDWAAVLAEVCTVLKTVWHRRKLRRGGLQRNRFVLVLRDVGGDTGQIDVRLARLAKAGVPNYFGPQRFGRDGGNVGRAWDMLAGKRRIRDRHLWSILLSTARSLLFNRVLSQRVRLGNWHRPLDGDVLMLDGSSATFPVTDTDDVLTERARILDLHPTGPLWGKGPSAATGPAQLIEHDALQGCEVWCAGLVRAGLAPDRRALRIRVDKLEWSWSDATTLRLSFELPAGGYATAVLRELVSA